MPRILFIVFFTLIASQQPALSQVDNLPPSSQKPDSLKSKFALFGSEDILEITLQFDLAAYLRKNLKGTSLDGIMKIPRSGNDTIDRKVKISTRGFFRLNYCSFPPMNLNFKKPLNAYQDSGKIKKIKLVTHCESSGMFEDYLLREYLIYKMFNLFTDTSFRVRLVRVAYVDEKNNRKPIKQYGFFIEPVNVMAQRLKTFQLPNAKITQKQVIPNLMTRVAIFNYMIGNYDWAVPNQHNVMILKTMFVYLNQMGIGVPYDFDFSGLVNPPYAIPIEDFGIETVRERLFMGMCRSNDEFRTSLAEFRNHKDAIYKLINDFPLLTVRSKRDMTGYLDEFFRQLESQSMINNLIEYLRLTCKPI